MYGVFCTQVMKGYAMSNIRKKSPLELTDLILKHIPSASAETIAGVISEWGDFFDDQRFAANGAVDFESAGPNGQPQSRSLDSEFSPSVKQLDS
jgi:hypothetical protein